MLRGPSLGLQRSVLALASQSHTADDYGNGASAVAGGTAPSSLPEASCPPVTCIAPSPATSEASQVASGSRQEALRSSPGTACVCPSPVGHRPASHRVPGPPAGKPRPPTAQPL